MRTDDDFPEGELIDLDEEAFRKRYAQVVAEMSRYRKWFELRGSYKGTVGIDYRDCSFQEITTPKYLALGRSSHYDEFLELLSARYGFPVRQSDYMVWIEPSNPYKSLSYYIETAEHIDFSLEGLTTEDVRKALDIGRKAGSRRELNTRFMTLWELNQIWFSANRKKTIWHVPADGDFGAYAGYLRRLKGGRRTVIYTL